VPGPSWWPGPRQGRQNWWNLLSLSNPCRGSWARGGGGGVSLPESFLEVRFEKILNAEMSTHPSLSPNMVQRNSKTSYLGDGEGF
jgi:hypothetical protein